MFQSALLAINQPFYPSISLVIQICYFIFNRLMLFAKLQYICSFTSVNLKDFSNSKKLTHARLPRHVRIFDYFQELYWLVGV
jgi:hypothetical protein